MEDTQTRAGSGTTSAILRQTAISIDGSHISIKALLLLVGEQGLLLFCILLTVPFLLPVAIPGMSTPFGLLILLTGIGIGLNRVPWMPTRLTQRNFAAEQIKSALNKGADLLEKLERFIKPRLQLLCSSRVNPLNGIAIVLAALLLMLPLGAIPFTNTLPAWTILLMCLGMLQKDGLVISAAYLLLSGTLLWFASLGLGLQKLLGTIPAFA